MTPIPFMLPDIGLREIAGSIYLTDRFLVIDIENALLGEFDKDRSTIEVEPGALAEVRLEKGLLQRQDHLATARSRSSRGHSGRSYQRSGVGNLEDLSQENASYLWRRRGAG